MYRDIAVWNIETVLRQHYGSNEICWGRFLWACIQRQQLIFPFRNISFSVPVPVHKTRNEIRRYTFGRFNVV